MRISNTNINKFVKVIRVKEYTESPSDPNIWYFKYSKKGLLNKIEIFKIKNPIIYNISFKLR